MVRNVGRERVTDFYLDTFMTTQTPGRYILPCSLLPRGSYGGTCVCLL